MNTNTFNHTMRQILKHFYTILSDHKREFAIFFFPYIVFFFYSFFLIENSKQLLKENISVAISGFITYCIYLLVRKWSKRFSLFAFLYLFFSLGVFIKVGFYLLYNLPFSSSAVFIVFETNLYEAYDFLELYLNIKLFALLFSLIAPLILIFFIRKKKYSVSTKNDWIFNLLLITAISINGVILIKKFKNHHLLLISTNSYKEYREIKKQMAFNFSENKSPNLTEVKRHFIPDEPEVHVVVIGESTTNWHMQLYGYEKETNPLLMEIKEELFIFDSVISPHVHTILSLEKMLSLANYDQPKPTENASIIQLANQAGFTTYWISNQRPIGIHESVATNISRAANKKYFLTSEEYFLQESLDEATFPILEKIIKEPAKRKVIFIQLIGTHTAYYKRYPKEFSKFDGDEDELLFPSDNAQTLRNQYDNAVLYNDFVIRNLIEILRKSNTSSSLIYLSDHGDEVFDTVDFVGHSEYRATRPMYEIPFIIWYSKKARAENLSPKIHEDYLQRRYNAEDFIHTFADLLSIDFKEKDNSRSVINRHFQRRTRWVKEGVDYDKEI